MVAMTRLDCVTGSASGMRAALVQAIHHTRHRRAFGALLADQPLMRNVLADLALESEAATVLAMRLAGAVDRGEMAFRRLAIAVGKYWVCKRQPGLVGEALECLGGNGYVEDSPMPRLYRDAPLNSIWEGSGNVQALDAIRTMRRDPDSVEAFLTESALAAGADRRLDEAIGDLKALLVAPDPAQARRIIERMALVLQGSLLVRYAPPATADAFCASRLGDQGQAYGTLPAGVDMAALIDRAAPRVAPAP
jgi:putative acyl-CoA dehydrogenase